MTVLSARAAASPLLVGAARLWIAAVLLLVAMLLTGDGPSVEWKTTQGAEPGRASSQATHQSHRPRGPGVE